MASAIGTILNFTASSEIVPVLVYTYFLYWCILIQSFDYIYTYITYSQQLQESSIFLVCRSLSHVYVLHVFLTPSILVKYVYLYF